MSDHTTWARTRVVAEMWWCGDDVCDCTQPVVVRITPNSDAGYPWIHRERLWAGTFVSTGDGYEPGERETQWRELIDAADRYNAERNWRDSDVPETLRRASPGGEPGDEGKDGGK